MRQYLLSSLVVVGSLCKIDAGDDAPASTNDAGEAKPVVIEIDPYTNRAIQGHLELDRVKYFNLSCSGEQFTRVLKNNDRAKTYLENYGISFGRSLSMVKGHTWRKTLVEDPKRPGYMDVDHFMSKIKRVRTKVPDSALVKSFFPSSSNVSLHENTSVYPKFMELWSAKGDEKHTYPANFEAAAEIVVNILKHSYTDYTRPLTYEIVNEPNWRLWKDRRLADLHLAVWKKAKEEKVPTEIGGACFAIPYYYRNNYNDLNTMTRFIDMTECKLDFYSFHAYDFLYWDKDKRDFTGRVTSGLPLEGVLDSIPNFSVNKFGREVPIVLTEHGGYLVRDKNNNISVDLAKELIGEGSGFEWDMKRREVDNFIMVSSAIGNTMTFMNHPHIVKKAVPFILLESRGWGPEYYASLLVGRDFERRGELVESPLINFYKFFADVKGRRIKSFCGDPDLQVHTFVDDRKLHVVMNNLADKETDIKFKFTKIRAKKKVRVKRFGRNSDFTPYYKDEMVKKFRTIGPRESVVLTIDLKSKIRPKKKLNEVPYYSTALATEVDDSEEFSIAIPEPENIDYAVLRVALARDAGSDHTVDLSLNGTKLDVPLEDIAEVLEDDKGYGTLKYVRIDPSLLKKDNVVAVSFADGKGGGVGSVIIRAGIKR